MPWLSPAYFLRADIVKIIQYELNYSRQASSPEALYSGGPRGYDGRRSPLIDRLGGNLGPQILSSPRGHGLGKARPFAPLRRVARAPLKSAGTSSSMGRRRVCTAAASRRSPEVGFLKGQGDLRKIEGTGQAHRVRTFRLSPLLAFGDQRHRGDDDFGRQSRWRYHHGERLSSI